MSKKTVFNPLLQRTDTSTHVDVPESVEEVTSGQTKFTFYFTNDQLARLDRLYIGLRKNGRRRVTKSQVVRVALDKLLDDYETNPDEILRALSA